MIHADTEGILDRCNCGAVAGFEHVDGFSLRARCTECCEQTGVYHDVYPVMIEWNIARRAEKEIGCPGKTTTMTLRRLSR